MADGTKIEWADASWNPIRARNKATGKIGWHCEHKNEACRHCYAEGFNLRLGTGFAFRRQDRDAVEIFLDEKMLTQPLHWKRPRRIFVCSMTDLFAEFVTDEMIDRIIAIAGLCPQHQFLALTKRPDRARGYLCRLDQEPERDTVKRLAAAMPPHPWPRFDAITVPLPNLWLGTSIHDQPSADEFVPQLLAAPVAIRFLSYEPALGPVDLRRIPVDDVGRERTADGWRFPPIHWVIAGGESGPNARPMHPDWTRSLRDQCAGAGVPFFFKQWGEWFPGELEDDGTKLVAAPDVEHDPSADKWELTFAKHERIAGTGMLRVGKKRAGRLLDGREHSEWPR